VEHPTIEDLQAAYAGPLFVYALRRLGDRGTAEEVVQDTLVQAWRAADRYDPARGSHAAWLFTIARNLVIDRHRRAAARPRPAAYASGDPEPLTDGEVDRAIEAWQLADGLARLSAEHREAIVLIHYQGYSVADAAARLGVPPGTVKSRVYYGLRALRLQLEESGVVR
jgi:RNA polymerase sigma-70 factor, ECF subfamily